MFSRIDDEVEAVALEGAVVDVLVEREAQLEDDPALDRAAGDLRVADRRAERALEDGVVDGDRREVVVVEHVAVAQEPVGADVEVGGLERRRPRLRP